MKVFKLSKLLLTSETETLELNMNLKRNFQTFGIRCRRNAEYNVIEIKTVVINYKKLCIHTGKPTNQPNQTITNKTMTYTFTII